jgi:hypothetical protein
VTDVRPNPELDPIVQNATVRALAVFHMRSEKSMTQGAVLSRTRPPDTAEMGEMVKCAGFYGLDAELEVAVDRVHVRKRGSGVILENTEFSLFRKSDVPYLMSLKTAMEVMGT